MDGHELLREYVVAALHERSRERDVQWRQVALGAWADMLRFFGRKSPDEAGMRVAQSDDGLTFVYAPFKKLGVKLPSPLDKVAFAIVIDPDGRSLRAQFIAPGGVDLFPDGAIVLPGADPAAAWLPAARVLGPKRDQFVHEFTHALDFLFRERSMLPNASKELERGKYWETEHEMNAYFHQAFDRMVDQLVREHPKITQSRIDDIVPSAESLWKRFWSNVNSQFRSKHNVDALRRRWVARLLNLWQHFVEELPV